MKRWNTIECGTCGYRGKPKDNFPELRFLHVVVFPFLIAFILRAGIYFLKHYPAHYSCPNCKQTRANHKNIQYVYVEKN